MEIWNKRNNVNDKVAPRNCATSEALNLEHRFFALVNVSRFSESFAEPVLGRTGKNSNSQTIKSNGSTISKLETLTE